MLNDALSVASIIEPAPYFWFEIRVCPHNSYLKCRLAEPPVTHPVSFRLTENIITHHCLGMPNKNPDWDTSPVCSQHTWTAHHVFLFESGGAGASPAWS